MQFTVFSDVKAVAQQGAKPTTLTHWFDYVSKTSVAADQFVDEKYCEYYDHHVYDNKTGWARRKRNNCVTVGRVHSVNVAKGELFYLRMLLCHLPPSSMDLSTSTDVATQHASHSFAALYYVPRPLPEGECTVQNGTT